MLKPGSQAQQIWQYFSLVDGDEKGLTVHAIHTGTGLRREDTMARVSEMVNEGLLVPTGEMRLLPPKYARRGKVYRRVAENEVGHGRDQVRVDITIKVNEYGEYSAECVIHGQTPHEAARAREGILQTVATRSTTALIPKPEEPYRIRKAAVDVKIDDDKTLDGVSYTVEN